MSYFIGLNSSTSLVCNVTSQVVNRRAVDNVPTFDVILTRNNDNNDDDNNNKMIMARSRFTLYCCCDLDFDPIYDLQLPT